MVRSRWWGRLFWLALISVMIVPSSAGPAPVRQPSRGVFLLSIESNPYLRIGSIGWRREDARLPPECPGSEGYGDFDYCLHLDTAMLVRPKASTADAGMAQAEARTVGWLLTNTDSKAALLPATGEEVWQRLHHAGYRQLVVRAARSDDPAPRGSIVHAIPFGTACLIGFQRTWDHVEADNVMGTLPGGGCLAP